MCRVNVRWLNTLANFCNHIIERFKSTFHSVPAPVPPALESAEIIIIIIIMARSLHPPFLGIPIFYRSKNSSFCFLTTSIQSGRRRNRSSIPGIGKAVLFSAAAYEYVMGAEASFVSRCPLPSSRMRGSASAISHAFSCMCAYFSTGTIVRPR
jgi:hypothetical protein